MQRRRHPASNDEGRTIEILIDLETEGRHHLTPAIYWFRIEPMEPGRKTRLRVLRGHDEDCQGHLAVLAMVRIVRSFTDATSRMAREHDLNLPRLEVLLCLN